MKRKFSSRKYATNKFSSRRFAGDRQIVIEEIINRIHYFTLQGPDLQHSFILYGPSVQYFEQTIKDIISCQTKYI